MRTILVAAIIALLAGVLYQQIVNNNMNVKETVAKLAEKTGDVAKYIGSEFKNNSISEKSAEHINNMKKDVEDILNSEEVKEKAAEQINKITAEEKRKMCNNSTELFKKYESKQEPDNAYEKALFTYFKEAEEKYGKINPDMYDALVTSFCNTL